MFREFNSLMLGKILEYKNTVKWIFVFFIAITGLILYSKGPFERIELLTVDYRFLLRPSMAASPEIVFIDMAEDSIESIGRWPWPRKWHAALVDILSRCGAKVIAFDVIFSEPQAGEEDLVFAEAVRQSGKVYLPVLYNLNTQNVRMVEDGSGIVSVLRPINLFRGIIKGTGHINIIPDQDGILRRVIPTVDYQGKRTYQFGLKIACDFLGLDVNKAIEEIPLDKNGEMIINWQGRWGKVFNHYSYIDVVHSYALAKDGEKPLLDLKIFKDKICIIGLTAPALIDIKPIPIENTYPAVGVNAMIINSVMKKEYIGELPEIFNMLLVVLAGMLVTLTLFGLRPLSGMLFALSCMIIYAVLSVTVFNFFHTIIVTFYPICIMALSYVLTASYVQIMHTAERTQLFKKATIDSLTGLYNIGHFNLLLDAEFRNIALYKNRRLTVMMIDIDNFKKINDTYGHQAGDAVLVEVANTIKSKCRQVDAVGRYGGEEFIIMLVGSGKGWALGVAEKMRYAVENKKFDFKEKKYNTTISIGLSEFSGERAKEELVEKADAALYRAKQEGKNRVRAFS